MSPFKRAILYLRRHLITVVIISVVYFFITVMLLLGFSIKNAVTTSENNVRATIFPVVQIETNRNDYLLDSHLDDILSMNIVSTLRATLSKTCFSDMQCIPLNNNVDNDGQPSFMVVSNYDSDLIELHNGDIEIVEGRFFSEEDDCENEIVISDEVASFNDVGIGDAIELSLDNQHFETYEVIGIYHTQESNDTTSVEYLGLYNYSSVYNRIYIPQETLITLIEETTKEVVKLQFSNVYVLLNDSMLVNEFEVELEDLKWNLNYTLTSEDSTFTELFKPLATIRYFASLINVVVIINGILVLFLIISITNYLRRKEIGLYLSYGVSKLSIIKQIVVEMMIVCLLGIIPGIIVGNSISDYVSNYILEKEMGKEEKYIKEDKDNISYYFTVIDEENFIDNYKIDKDIKYYFNIVGSVVFITVITSGISVIMIVRKNPKDIINN